MIEILEFEKELLNNINDEWYNFFKEERNKTYYYQLFNKLYYEYQNYTVYPNKEDVFRLFRLLSLSKIKVVIIGQDPYHTKNVADGLAFSSRSSKIPPSLKNIFKELNNDLGIDNNKANLQSWLNEGVFLLNSILSVRENQAKSHHKIGWQDFINNLIKYIDDNNKVIFVLWGKQAQLFKKVIKNGDIIEGSHPSPLAGKAFFNQKYFSRINAILKNNNKEKINWQIK